MLPLLLTLSRKGSRVGLNCCIERVSAVAYLGFHKGGLQPTPPSLSLPSLPLPPPLPGPYPPPIQGP